MYTGRENFCTDFKKHRCRSCSGRWNSPKSGKKFLERGRKKETVYHGKQSMEKLKAHNQELSNIEVTDGNIRSFEKYARKYDIDYCLKKDRSAEPPKYYVFLRRKKWIP